MANNNQTEPTKEELKVFSVSGNVFAIGGRDEYSGLVYLSDLQRFADLKKKEGAVEANDKTADLIRKWMRTGQIEINPSAIKEFEKGRNEMQCPHGVGHGPHVHGCDGCCSKHGFVEMFNREREKEAKRFFGKEYDATKAHLHDWKPASSEAKGKSECGAGNNDCDSSSSPLRKEGFAGQISDNAPVILAPIPAKFEPAQTMAYPDSPAEATRKQSTDEEEELYMRVIDHHYNGEPDEAIDKIRAHVKKEVEATIKYYECRCEKPSNPYLCFCPECYEEFKHQAVENAMGELRKDYVDSTEVLSRAGHRPDIDYAISRIDARYPNAKKKVK